MAKKKASKPEAKVSVKAAKKEKAAKKLDQKEKKKAGKSKDREDDDQDLEAILEEMRKNWEDQHKVTEELVEGPPSRRANASLTPCPNGNHLWCIGGEFFSEDNKAHFYNDVFRYSPEKDEWRKFVSPTCPGPRSAHAVVASPTSGGKLFLFGGEFSSLNQTTFHHYRDFWCFDITTHSWDRIETKVMPSARSGHRMAMWKHYVVLFGGFYDPGIRTNYLDDLWLFDTQEYKWKQAEFKPNERRPSPRSGFSFLPTADGILLHGGYCKEYSKGKRPVGVMLDDTWFLHMSMPTEADLKPSSSSAFLMPILKWEKRKRPSTAFAPSLRSGCTMSLWQAKNMGILFGGVTDEDTGEETMESIFHNDLYGYQIAGNGRWVSLALKRPKQKKKGNRDKRRRKEAQKKHNEKSDAESQQDSVTELAKTDKKKQKRKRKKAMGGTEEETAVLPVSATPPEEKGGVESEEASEADSGDDSESDKPWLKAKPPPPMPDPTHSDDSAAEEVDPDDPSLTVPLPRYNAMSAVLRNTLYIYGGIFEKGSREYTLDDFHFLMLDKLDRFVCLKPTDVVIPTGSDESSSDDSDESGSSSEDTLGEEDEVPPKVALEASTRKLKRLALDASLVEIAKDPKSPKAAGKRRAAQIVDERQKAEGANEVIIAPAVEYEKVANEDEEVSEKESPTVKVPIFMGVEKDAAVSSEDVLGTPLPGETMAMFYSRSKEHWSQKAFVMSGSRGKALRSEGFKLARARYNEYKPTLQELENILAESGVDREDMRQTAAAGPDAKTGQSRNRR